MVELNLKQITDKLNAEFVGDTRKLVFWYDDKAEFAEDIDTLELVNARVYNLEPDNQFYTKYLLERLDRTTNYLIYAPFPKPPVRDNHLEDTLLYSKQFFADRASLLTVDLGIDAKYKPVIQKYIKFFRAKDRTQRFYNLEIENFTRDTIEIALMSALCKTRTASFEEVVRVILTDGELEDNKILAEFDKYDLLPAFWRFCEQQFGYNHMKPTLEKLVITLFITYTERSIRGEVPEAWKSFVSYKSGSIIA
ncbi:MAG: BREX-1 system phosphatase PglZ type A, partial [Syntrophomonadaceae bacterium]|nr:BREX-1 system phosphatase PglZ type A [Syntrophomonadaceae bacterium]